MVIQHNLAAMNSSRQYSIVSARKADETEKLSSGYRINKAADDAAGLSISEKMRKQVRGLTQASENAEDGISLIQTADGALAEVTEILQRMNELCVQAANGTNSQTDRGYIQNEVTQLITEVNRVAESTKFNEIYLLDGSIGKKNALSSTSAAQTMTLPEVSALDGVKLIYTEEVSDVDTTQTGTDSPGLTGAAYDTLKDTLEQSIVPQAVKAILASYPDTFGYLSDSSIGIGLYLYDDATSSTLASVTVGTAAYVDGTELSAAYLSYKLSVNIATLKNGSAIDLSSANRDALEVTIIHEMTHALMDEALTNGMIGYGGGTSFDKTVQFPHWFKEGMAQTAAGGCYDGNDWVNGALGITPSSSLTDIKTALAAASLSSGSTTSQYGTGYLACMYLGYLANGAGSVTQAGLQKGIDKILSEIKGSDTTTAKSLNDVIAEYTGYADAAAFERAFGTTDAQVQFILDLVTLAGSGTGGLSAGFSSENGILPDTTVVPAISLFKLNTQYGTVENVYPSGYPVYSGGTLSTSGKSGPGSAASGGNGGNGSGNGNGSGGNGTTIKQHVTDYGSLRLQIGADAENGMILRIDAMNAQSIGISTLSVETENLATQGIDTVAAAIRIVSAQRSTLGAYQNRLEHTVNNLGNVVENTTAAESQIRDADMAQEMVTFSLMNMLAQTGEAMLSQANQSNQGVMTLIAA